MMRWPGRTGGPILDPASGPVVVGGLGGSGTRVVAEMLRHLGVYTGADLNRAGDNEWFAFLCKLPRWDLEEAGPDAAALAGCLDLLERAMTGQVGPDRADRRTIRAVLERCRSWADGEERLPDDRSLDWLRARVASLGRSRRDTPTRAAAWGWKEPNSHLFVPQLRRRFGDRLRYVHVIRNGLYMAQSTNQSQVRRWGPGFGIPGATPSPDPVASLDFWIAANRLAISRGRAMPAGTFLLLNHDDLCASPEEGVARFLGFLGLDPPARVVEQLVGLPNPPKPPPLTAEEMIRQFGVDRLAQVRALGFPAAGAR